LEAGLSLWSACKTAAFAFGSLPGGRLAEARRASIEARVLLAKGVNPVERRNADKDTKAGAAVCTFDAIATELVAKKIREGKTERTAKKLRWLFELASHLSVTAR
jgi:hypothetical protein